jgi:hypothetical protein
MEHRVFSGVNQELILFVSRWGIRIYGVVCQVCFEWVGMDCIAVVILIGI